MKNTIITPSLDIVKSILKCHREAYGRMERDLKTEGKCELYKTLYATRFLDRFYKATVHKSETGDYIIDFE
jgi:hypothetical protein